MFAMRLMGFMKKESVLSYLGRELGVIRKGLIYQFTGNIYFGKSDL
jgi:hypothetical protein